MNKVKQGINTWKVDPLAYTGVLLGATSYFTSLSPPLHFVRLRREDNTLLQLRFWVCYILEMQIFSDNNLQRLLLPSFCQHNTRQTLSNQENINTECLWIEAECLWIDTWHSENPNAHKYPTLINRNIVKHLSDIHSKHVFNCYCLYLLTPFCHNCHLCLILLVEAPYNIW